MIKRYQIQEIKKIWSYENKMQTWWLIEKYLCEAYYKEKIISQSEWDQIQKFQFKFDSERMEELEKNIQHDVVAFTTLITEQAKRNWTKWIHFGITSSDIVDTSQNYLIKQSNLIVEKELNQLLNLIKQKAILYKETLIIGRTHGRHAEPISLGVKFLQWYSELKRDYQMFDLTKHFIEVSNVSGSLGNYAHIKPEVHSYVSQKLGLIPDWSASQINSRDRHINFFNSFSSFATSLEKIAIQFRFWQISDVNEILEGFDTKNQKGSSSMPHKQNPISAENICGLARLIRNNVRNFDSNNLLWQDRDISHSSNERIIIPNLYHTLIYIIKRMHILIKNMVVNKNQISQNMLKSNNIFYSQTVMNYLLLNSSRSRKEIYDLIQSLSIECLKTNRNFLSILRETKLPDDIKFKDLDSVLHLKYFLKNNDKIYQKILG